MGGIVMGWGGWLGGFAVAMVPAGIFLFFAGFPKRRPGIAIFLRVIAILAAMFFAFAEYVGSEGQLNPGGLVGIVAAIAWALKQQLTRKESVPAA